MRLRERSGFYHILKMFEFSKTADRFMKGPRAVAIKKGRYDRAVKNCDFKGNRSVHLHNHVSMEIDIEKKTRFFEVGKDVLLA